MYGFPRASILRFVKHASSKRPLPKRGHSGHWGYSRRRAAGLRCAGPACIDLAPGGTTEERLRRAAVLAHAARHRDPETVASGKSPREASMEQVRTVCRRRWADANATGSGGQWSMGDRWPLLVSVLADEQAELLRVIEERGLHSENARSTAPAGAGAAYGLRTRAAHQSARPADRAPGRRPRAPVSRTHRAAVRPGAGGAGRSRHRPGAGAPSPNWIWHLPRCTSTQRLPTPSSSAWWAWMLVHGHRLALQTGSGPAGAGPVLTATSPRVAPRVATSGLPPRRRLDDGLELLLLQQAVWANGPDAARAGWARHHSTGRLSDADRQCRQPGPDRAAGAAAGHRSEPLSEPGALLQASRRAGILSEPDRVWLLRQLPRAATTG